MDKIISIEKSAIADFMHNWPCSQLNNIHHITAIFNENGELIDLEVYVDEAEDIFIDAEGYYGSGAMPELLREAFLNCQELPTPYGTISNNYIYE